MGAAAKYDYPEVEAYRAKGLSWDETAEAVGAPSGNTLRSSFYRWQKRQDAPNGEPAAGPDTGPDPTPSIEATLTAEQISRITSLDDLLTFFKVDTERWEVRDYRVNKWEQAAKNKRTQQPIITPLYQVRANLIPRIEHRVELARQAAEEIVRDMAHHAPAYVRPEWMGTPGQLSEEGVCLEVDILDPHLGMLAWGREVGADYDLDISVQHYTAAAERLLSLSNLYNVARVLYVVGHDFLHVDGPAMGPKGSGRGGATTAGTPQDLDTRLAKLFTAGRRALVQALDLAREVAPVDAVVVPGNHDEQSMYRMGEVLNAWYRLDDAVSVVYGPMRRKFYGWGSNAFMLTHGEEYRRKRDNLALIMATECPAELWVRSEGGTREVHTGHNHVALQGGYYPTAELDESRGIRVRSLPGLTPEDSWHFTEGYHHKRAATAFLWHHQGGMAGHHEFSL